MEDHRVLACKVLLTLSVLALLAILLAVTDAFGISRWLGLGTLPWLSGAGLLTAASATGYGKHHQITDLVRTVCWIVLALHLLLVASAVWMLAGARTFN